MIRIIFFIVVFGGGFYLLINWAVKAWKKADVDQKVDDLKLDNKIYSKVKNVDIKKAKKSKQVVDDFLKE